MLQTFWNNKCSIFDTMGLKALNDLHVSRSFVSRSKRLEHHHSHIILPKQSFLLLSFSPVLFILHCQPARQNKNVRTFIYYQIMKYTDEMFMDKHSRDIFLFHCILLYQIVRICLSCDKDRV